MELPESPPAILLRIEATASPTSWPGSTPLSRPVTPLPTLQWALLLPGASGAPADHTAYAEVQC